MGWFKRGLPPHQTALAMIGARAGERVLFAGAAAADLAAEVALVTGLNGRTLVVDPAEGARERVERAAAEAGALVDFEAAPATAPPVDDDSVDIVVLAIEPGGSVADVDRTVAGAALRVLRPGGRIVVRRPAKRAGLFAARAAPDASVTDALSRAGAVAVRHLADADGVAYFEARKARD
jgi:ubiquinone/menaquinone biosynthesis C-methylase UbiE